MALAIASEAILSGVTTSPSKNSIMGIVSRMFGTGQRIFQEAGAFAGLSAIVPNNMIRDETGAQCNSTTL
jgi:hypothetical protein